MSTWKKVHIEDADTTHGSITASLTQNGAVPTAGSYRLVVVGGTGEQELQHQQFSFGSGAFATVTGSNTGDEVAATTEVSGIVELATDTETNAGTDTARAITPSNLAAFTGSSNIVTLGTITTGTWQGTDVGVAHGGTGASSAADARTNLGLVIGTDVLAYDANLQSFITALDLPTSDGSANQVLATNGSGTLSFVSAAVNTDEDVSDANLRTRLAALDNSADITIGDDTDTTVVIAGNLTVNGTTTTINSTTLEVDDKNIVLASGAASASAANAAGITVDVDADASYSVNPELQWLSTHSNFSEWAMKKGGGEDTAYIAAMLEESNFTNLDGKAPGIGTFGMVGGDLYIQTGS